MNESNLDSIAKNKSLHYQRRDGLNQEDNQNHRNNDDTNSECWNNHMHDLKNRDLEDTNHHQKRIETFQKKVYELCPEQLKKSKVQNKEAHHS